MSVNVKIGDHIENGVDSVKLENADSSGSYCDFVYETGNQDITDLSSTSVVGKSTAQVSAAERAKIIAGNIKNGVSILGVTGTALVTTITVNQDDTIDLTIA